MKLGIHYININTFGEYIAHQIFTVTGSRKSIVLEYLRSSMQKGRISIYKKHEIATDLESLYEKLSYKLNFVDEITT